MKRTSKEWEKIYAKETGVIILYPDGWDRVNYDYSWGKEEITKEEFLSRVSKSTIMQSEEFKQ